MRFVRLIVPFILCLIISIGSDYLTLREALSVPTGKYYTFGHNAISDYFYYLSIIQEGTRGKFFISSRFTTVLVQPQLAQPFLTAIGFLGGNIGLSPVSTYFLTRILGGALLLYLVYLAGKILFGKKAYMALAFVLLSVPMWYRKDGIFFQWCDFWSGFDPIYRITFLPHHLFANIFGFASLLTVYQYFKTHRARWGLLGILCIIASISTNPAISLIYVLSILAALSITFFQGINKRRIFFLMLSYGVISGIVYVFFYRVYNSSVIWNVTDVERQLAYPIDAGRFLLVLGPIAIISLLQILTNKKWSFLSIALTAWFLLPIAILFLFPFISSYIPLVIIRFVQSAPYIPTGLLAALGCARGYRYLRKKHILLRFGGLAGCSALLFLAIPTYIINIGVINKQFDFDMARDPRIYIYSEAHDALMWLNREAHPDEVILAVEPISYMVPVFTHLIVPTGAPSVSLETLYKSYEIFTYKETPAIRQFLSFHRISYLLTYTYEEPNSQFLKTFGWKEVYRNSRYIIYHRDILSNFK